MEAERKMACNTRGKRSLGFFAALHSLSTADFAKPSRHKKARTTIEGGRLFEVDRLVLCSKGERSEFACIHIDVVPQNVIVITTNVSFFLKLLPRRCRNIN